MEGNVRGVGGGKRVMSVYSIYVFSSARMEFRFDFHLALISPRHTPNHPPTLDYVLPPPRSMLVI